jgi:hypothetical protein
MMVCQWKRCLLKRSTTRHRVSVQEVVTFGRDENGVLAMGKVMLGSNRQRAILYRNLAITNKWAPDSARIFRQISFRDAFPKEYMENVRRLVAKDKDIKKKGNISSFGIISQGDACIPVLQIRKKSGEKWRVYLEEKQIETN